MHLRAAALAAGAPPAPPPRRLRLADKGTAPTAAEPSPNPPRARTRRHAPHLLAARASQARCSFGTESAACPRPRARALKTPTKPPQVRVRQLLLVHPASPIGLTAHPTAGHGWPPRRAGRAPARCPSALLAPRPIGASFGPGPNNLLDHLAPVHTHARHWISPPAQPVAGLQPPLPRPSPPRGWRVRAHPPSPAASPCPSRRPPHARPAPRSPGRALRHRAGRLPGAAAAAGLVRRARVSSAQPRGARAPGYRSPACVAGPRAE
jgi:hypothetical protein